jgi:hypothetical protein
MGGWRGSVGMSGKALKSLKGWAGIISAGFAGVNVDFE